MRFQTETRFLASRQSAKDLTALGLCHSGWQSAGLVGPPRWWEILPEPAGHAFGLQAALQGPTHWVPPCQAPAAFQVATLNAKRQQDKDLKNKKNGEKARETRHVL